jgi:DNA-binding transcriptional ArsR family regulator
MTKTSVRQGYKNKFTVISNKLAQNNNLSLKARGLMCYFLSLPDDWIIYVDQLAKVMKEKKCAISSGLSELKEAGYVHHIKLGFKEGWQYFTFGEPISKEEFKLFLRTTRFSNSSENEQFGNQQLQKTNLKDKEQIYIKNKENITKENPGATGATAPLASNEAHDLSPFSKDVIEILELLKKSLRSLKADYRITASQEKNWSLDIDKILKIDKRDPNEVKQIVTWVAGDKFWAPNIKSGSKLRNQYDSLAIKMNEAKALKDNEKYKVFANKVKTQGRKFSLNINNNGVFDSSAGLELTYNMPYEDFCRCIAKAYNISNYERDM